MRQFTSKGLKTNVCLGLAFETNLEVWLVEWWWSVPSVQKFAGLTPPLAATWGPWESPSLVIACMM